MDILIQPATINQLSAVSEVLCEAAKWLEQHSIPLWTQTELQPEVLRSDVEQGLYILASQDGSPAGVLRHQLEDTTFWPDATAGEAAYIHRVAIRRVYAGGATSAALLNWSVQRARNDLRKFLRLDCAHDRIKLRSIYERFGFSHHSDRHVGPYHVARYQIRVS